MIVKQIINNVTEYDLTKDIKLLNNIFVIDDKVFKIFQPKRVFIVKDSKTIRGKHAHKKIHQFLVSLNGIINIKCLGKVIFFSNKKNKVIGIK